MPDTPQVLHRNTPTVAVVDNRGLTVRTIVYCRRPDELQVTDERITYQQHDSRGVLERSADPRLATAGRANFTYLTDLAGTALHTRNVDAGISITFNDAAGRPFLAVSQIGIDAQGNEDWSQAVTRTWSYEDRMLAGRPVGVTEQVAGNPARVTERFVWAGTTAQAQANNLVGQAVSHYDPAGLVKTTSITLSGVPNAVTRQLLKEADNPEVVADWQGEDASDWDTRLALETYTTQTSADATGALLTTLDAAGNLQRVAYDVAGQLRGSWLTIAGKAEQVIVQSVSYSAAGQKLREVHGNGVVTTYTYEPDTQRLSSIKTERQGTGAKVLQDLRYAYDPVGNVLKIRNDAEATRFWRNQKVVPENTYTYDSLYQLASATGREMANAGQPGRHLPHVTPFDNTTYTPYTRMYRYDTAGNLLQVRHSAPATNHNYTTDITVSDRSNRAVLSTLAQEPSAVEALFTPGGQQAVLLPGQPVVWSSRAELKQVVSVKREGATDDGESYRYDSHSQRVLKASTQRTARSTQSQRVIYLPGLELRTHTHGGTLTQDLQVMTVGEAGRAQVRALHWAAGKPDDLANDQLRYSYDNLLGSSALEVDGAGNLISQEEYYPFGGTAVWVARNEIEASYKTVRYSGKERDATGLYYYGYRYYQPWVGRWLSADPAGPVDGLNLFWMVGNNPTSAIDRDGRVLEKVMRFLSERGPSPLVQEFQSYARAVNANQQEGVDEATRQRDGEILGQLASKSKDLPALMIYTEGGNDAYRLLNGHLRGTLSDGDEEQFRQSYPNLVKELKDEVSGLEDYEGVAYRMLTVPPGVYGRQIRENDVVIDQGYMSASALLRNTTGWGDWATTLAGTGDDQVALVLDETVPKKMAPTTFLADHILITPYTQLKVKEISKTGNGMMVVRLKGADHAYRHDVKDIYSGEVRLERNTTWLADKLRVCL
ncbi:RHS repeat protein [Pseudomonas sp. p1(2021b)]|uniref:RHS repeat domain-containing protein n=1 Tax=Pseudomonas sp. p1(2021b) TaxID=2874628 RepID=UPI001CCDB75C|nr:RHS repeat domain-containing protein [Pseudomonas sp. p1(2021b)]UBM27365.1 RHS repeat protein [Pseudomonas sp. p1(2021b)]